MSKHILILFTFLFFPLLGISQIPHYLPQDSLIAWYPFNGNADDESDNSHNGIINGATLTTDRDSNEASAYYFNGDFISVADHSDFDFTSTMTISIWFTVDAGQIFDWNGILSKYPASTTTSDGYALRMDKSETSSQILKVNIPPGDPTYHSGDFNSDSNLWHHAVITVDGSSRKLYVDGSLSVDRTDNTAITINNNPITIGGQNGSYRSWKGKIDDVAIWNRALTEKEIKQIYQPESTNLSEYRWTRLLDSEEITNQITSLSARPYAFNREAREIYILNVAQKSFFVYDIDSNELVERNLTNYPSFDRAGDYIYNPSNNTIQFWRSGTDNVYQFDINGGEITQVGFGSYDSGKYGSDPIYNGVTEKPALMFGYGSNEVRNAAFELDSTGSWVTKKPNSSTQPYKRGTIILPNEDYTKGLIIDGLGNQSGSQFEDSCSVQGAQDAATDVGTWCWFGDIWEVNLEDWSSRNILPVNSDVPVTSRFGYNYETNTFYSFGGYKPVEVYGMDPVWDFSLYEFNPDADSGWKQVTQAGDIPTIEAGGVSFYDAAEKRFIVFIGNTISELRINNKVNERSSSLAIRKLLIDSTYTKNGYKFSSIFSLDSLSASDSLAGYQFELPIPRGITYDSLKLYNNHSENISLQTSETNNELSLAASSSSFISESDTLVELFFTADSTGLFDLIPQNVKLNSFDVTNITAGQVTVEPFLAGDVDDSGEVDNYDAAIVLHRTANSNLLSPDSVKWWDDGPWYNWRDSAADVDQDGTLLAMDATYILQKVVGKIETYPITTPSVEPITYEYTESGIQFITNEKISAGNIHIPLPTSSGIKFEKPNSNWEDSNFVINNEMESISIAFTSVEPKEGIIAELPISLLSDEEYIINVITYANTTRNVEQIVLNRQTVNNEDTDIELPQRFVLQQNYPNPFNPSTQIRYGIPQAAEVELAIFNMLGQKVATLVDGKQNSGWHTATFDASNLSSGVYIYRIKAGKFVSTKKMLLIK